MVIDVLIIDDEFVVWNVFVFYLFFILGIVDLNCV